MTAAGDHRGPHWRHPRRTDAAPMLRALAAYVAEHGQLPSRSYRSGELAVGLWLRNQRRAGRFPGQHGRYLDPETKAALDRLDPHWLEPLRAPQGLPRSPRPPRSPAPATLERALQVAHERLRARSSWPLWRDQAVDRFRRWSAPDLAREQLAAELSLFLRASFCHGDGLVRSRSRAVGLEQLAGMLGSIGYVEAETVAAMRTSIDEASVAVADAARTRQPISDHYDALWRADRTWPYEIPGGQLDRRSIVAIDHDLVQFEGVETMVAMPAIADHLRPDWFFMRLSYRRPADPKQPAPLLDVSGLRPLSTSEYTYLVMLMEASSWHNHEIREQLVWAQGF